MKYLLWIVGALAFVTLLSIIFKIPKSIYVSDKPDQVTEKEIYVSSVTKTCEGVVTSRCLQIKYTPDEAWQNFYGQISGFTHEVGVESKLLVREEMTENTQADGSNVTYELVETLESNEVSYVAITSPVDGDKVKVGEDFVVKGTGRGLFENNVVVQFGTGGGILAEEITTITTDEVGGEGEWEVIANVEMLMDTPGTISAWSPSPKEGEDGLRFTTSVMYSVTDGQEVSLEGTDWNLTKLMKDDMTGLLEPTGDITALFENTRLSGSGGCNNYGTSYTLNGENTISISEQINSTMMVCIEDGISTQETLYFSQLPKVKKYNINGIDLIMMNDKGETLMVFETTID